MTLYAFAELTSPAAAALGRDPRAIGVVPLGAVEQHGPHLPLASDSLLADAVCRAAAARLPVPVVVAPVVTGGLSDRHLAFPGTMSLREATFADAVRALLDALARAGLSRLALVTAHGGNDAAARAIAEQASVGGSRVRAFEFDDYLRSLRRAAAEMGVAVPETDVHAGALETSLALHLFPHLVGPHDDVHGYTAAEPGWWDRLAHEGVHTLSPIGVVGDPSLASVELGARAFEALTDDLAAWLQRCFEQAATPSNGSVAPNG